MDGVSVGGEWGAVLFARRGSPGGVAPWSDGGGQMQSPRWSLRDAVRPVRAPAPGDSATLSVLSRASSTAVERMPAGLDGRRLTSELRRVGRPYGLRKPTVHPASPAPFPPERERDSRYVEGESAYVAGRRLGAETVKRVDGPWTASAGSDLSYGGSRIHENRPDMRNASRVLALGRLGRRCGLQGSFRLRRNCRGNAAREPPARLGPSQSVHLLRLQSAFAADGGGVAPPLL